MDHSIILYRVSTNEDTFVRWTSWRGETPAEVGKKLSFEYWFFSVYHSLYQINAHS